jgi:PAS domain S-box-containing protein
MSIVSFSRTQEPELHDSEELCRRLFESSSERIELLDRDGRILRLNPRAQRALCVEDVERVRGRRWEELWDETCRVSIGNALTTAQSGAEASFEGSCRPPEATLTWWIGKIFPLRDRDGVPSRFLVVARENDERTRREADLQSDAERLRRAVEAASLGTWFWDLRTGAMVGTDLARAVFGIPPGTPMSYERFLEALHPDDRDRVDEAVRRAVREKGEYDSEYRTVWPDGSVHWVGGRGRAYYDALGRPVCLEGIALDITHRKVAEAARRSAEAKLVEREAQLALAIEYCPAPIAMFDRNMHYIAASRRWLSDFQIQGSVVGRDHYDVFPDLPQRWRDIHQRCLAGAVESCDEDAFIRGNGQVNWLRWEIHPWRTASGQVGGIVMFAEMINERKRAEEQLRLSEERLRLAVTGAALGTWHWDLRTGQLVWSELSFAMFGLEPSPNMTYERFRAAVHPDDCVPMEEAIRRSIREHSDYSVEIRAVWPDGSVHWLSTKGRAFYDQDGTPVRMEGVAHDITPSKQAEQALRESEERFRHLTERLDTALRAAGMGTWVWHFESGGLQIDESLAQLLGLSPDEARRTTLDSVLTRVHAEDQKAVREALDRARAHAGEFEAECRLPQADGRNLWLAFKGRVEPDESGRTSQLFGACVDITRHKRLEEELRQAQKMEAIGRLAGGVAHDFNNLLTVILGQASVLERRPDLPPGVARAIGDITGAAERAASLTGQLLAFGRRQMLQARDLNLNDVVASVGQMLQRLLGENIALQIEPSPCEPRVHADPNMLAQVVLNLALNARDAMPSGGRLTIRASSETLDERSAHSTADVRAGSWACLSVSDTGTGVPPEILPRIFEPFFTTKEVGKGTGLGLSTVYGILKQHHGWISVESTKGRGTTFKACLPRIVSEDAPQRDLPPKRAVEGRGELILLVEDEPAVRSVVSSILEQHGYRLIVVEDGRKAVEAFRMRSAEIDLLLSDVVMPGGLSGTELALQLHAHKPELRIILCSGYSTESISQDIQTQPHTAFLQKPYRSEDLLLLLRRVLDEA